MTVPETEEQRIQRKRERYSFTAARLDELRAVFVEDADAIKATFACQDGHQTGRSVNDLPGTWFTPQPIDIRSREQVLADMKAKGQW